MYRKTNSLFILNMKIFKKRIASKVGCFSNFNYFFSYCHDCPKLKIYDGNFVVSFGPNNDTKKTF